MRRIFHLMTIIFCTIVLMLTSTLKAEPAKQYPMEPLSHTIIVPEDFPTIQEAVNAADVGDTVCVRNGTYNENVQLNKTINLIGENPHTTIINGSQPNAAYNPTITTYGETFHTVRICNFTIAGSQTAWGIYICFNSIAYVENNIITGNSGGILVSYHNNTITNNLVVNNKHEGILISGSSNNTLRNNTMGNNEYNFGIAQGSFNHDIDTSNTISMKPIYYIKNQANLQINPTTYPDMGFLALVNCTKITVENLTLHSNYNGLILEETSNSTIRNNTFRNNAEGLNIINSPNITIQSNNVTNNTWKALTIDHSSNATLKENRFKKNYFNLQITGDAIGDFMHDIDTSNTVDGKLMRYIRNSTNLNIDSSAFSNTGYLAIVNCHNVTARNFAFGNNEILAAFTTNSSVTDNTITNGSITLTHCSFMNLTANALIGGETGISLSYSNNNTITKNHVAEYVMNGIALESSYDNSVSDNDIKNGTTGMNFDESNDNVILRNNITNNKNYGISLGTSTHNLFYHNNLINHVPMQVVSLMTITENYFENGYPSGGNYWIDYNGTDQKSGSGQNLIGSDGIGDTYYVGFFGLADKYPLMQPIRTFDAGMWQNEPRSIDIVSNSTLSGFQVDVIAREVSFNVTGEASTDGFCRIVIPNIIVQSMWAGNYSVIINGQPLQHRDWTDTQNTYVYINYTHSEQTIIIVPELLQPSTIALLTVVATFSAFAAKKLNRSMAKKSLT